MQKKELSVALGLVVDSEGRLLATRRNEPDNAVDHGKWQFVGGAIEYEERPEQAVVREVKEEVGLDVKVKNMLPRVITAYWDSPDGSSQVKLYLFSFVCVILGGELSLADSEILETRFVSKEEFMALDVMRNVREILEMY
ncbi:MAG TPA: NUDIX hydrolase [Patescibacteria group bacterium]|nr:NUDIX hydrolase [Patescibacteria group bacterium]